MVALGAMEVSKLPLWPKCQQYTKIHSMVWDQFRGRSSSSHHYVQGNWKRLWKSYGRGSSKERVLSIGYSRAPCKAFNGVLPLHNIHAKVCD